MLATSARAVPTRNSSTTPANRPKHASPFMIPPPPRRIESRSLDHPKLWHKLDQRRRTDATLSLSPDPHQCMAADVVLEKNVNERMKPACVPSRPGINMESEL